MQRVVPAIFSSPVLIGALLIGTANGQTQTTVVPVQNTNVEGNALDARPFWTDRSRLTQLLDKSLVNIPFGKTITEIAYRRDKFAAPNATLRRRSTPTWSVRLANLNYNAPPQRVGTRNYPGGQAWNPRNPLGLYLHPSLNQNRLVEVYNTATVFPPLPPVTGNTGPFVLKFKFARPFVYNGPSGLAIDHYVYAARNVTVSYFVDAVRASVDAGKATNYGVSCPQGKMRSNITPANPGGRLEAVLFDGPPNSAAVAILGGSRTQWGPIRLPFALDGLGLRGCNVYASLDILLPIATFSNGSATARLRIPEQVGFAGLNLFFQWMGIDGRINPSLPLTFSNGTDVTLGRTVGGTALPAAFLYGDRQNNAVRGLFGLVDRGITLVTQITYQ